MRNCESGKLSSKHKISMATLVTASLKLATLFLDNLYLTNLELGI